MGERRNHRKIRKYFELNEDQVTAYQNLWDAGKVALRVVYKSVNVHIKKTNI